MVGLYAIASKPGQSLAPMLGWFVLRSAGYDPAAVAADNSSAVTTATDNPQVAGLPLEGPSPTPSPLLVPHPPQTAVSDALLALLIWLPAAVAIVQIVLWMVYELHGANLAQLKARARERTHGSIV